MSDVVEDLDLKRAITESLRTHQEEQRCRQLAANSLRLSRSNPPEHGSGVVLRRPSLMSTNERQQPVGLLNPPPSSSGRRQPAGDLMKFDDDVPSGDSSTRFSGDWKSFMSLEDIENLSLNYNANQNRASGSSYTSSEESNSFSTSAPYTSASNSSPNTFPATFVSIQASPSWLESTAASRSYDIPPRLPPRLPVNQQLLVKAPALLCNSSMDVLKVLEKKPNEDLIDLAPPSCSSLGRGSVLAVFDPLNSSNDEDEDDDVSASNGRTDALCEPKEDDWTYFETYADPFQFMYEQSSRGSERDDLYNTPGYCSVGTSQADEGNVVDFAKSSATNDAVVIRNVSHVGKSGSPSKGKLTFQPLSTLTCLSEVEVLRNAITLLRGSYPSHDPSTNPGFTVSPLVELGSDATTLSVKILVYSFTRPNHPVAFTSDLTASVDHVIAQAVCELSDSQNLSGNLSDYVFKVRERGEIVDRTKHLFEIQYVHSCVKFDVDVKFDLIPITMVRRPFLRTEIDDVRDVELPVGALVPSGYGDGISAAKLGVIFDVFNSEMSKLLKIASNAVCGSELTTKPCIQAAKALCAILLEVETPEITKGIRLFTTAASLDRSSTYSPLQLVKSGVAELESAFRSLLDMYLRCHRVDFSLGSKDEESCKTIDLRNQIDTLLLRIGSAHRLDQTWSNYKDFRILVNLFHGTRRVGQRIKTPPHLVESSFYDRIVFDDWLNVETTVVCTLPRESRLVFTLVAVQKGDGDTSIQQPEQKPEYRELAWAGLQMFDESGKLAQGRYLLTMWPMDADPLLGPAPSFYAVPAGLGLAPPLLIVELPDLGGDVLFPPPLQLVESVNRQFEYLDENTQQLLLDIVESDVFAPIEPVDREILWEKRHYLHAYPRALPKVLLAALSWEWSCLSDLHAMVREWAPLRPVDALVLLLPCFPDLVVRRKAVEWLGGMGSDELIEYLPQLIQALKYETYLNSDLVLFLMERSLTSPNFAHRMHWLLDGSGDDTLRKRFAPTLKIISRALTGICGQSLRDHFESQRSLVRYLNDSAAQVREARENLRKATLDHEMNSMHRFLVNKPTALPLSLTHIACGIEVRHCSYFTSNTLPLKVAFITQDSEDTNGVVNAIYKVGDDLRQDILTMQMVRIMDRLWVKEGLDLKLVHFDCVATGHKTGFVEMVTEADTLRKIQAEFGLTGAFKDRPIAEWLKKHNPSKLDYERGVENFTLSCAGYCVATYFLGVCDRHNDNIMLKTTGHMFHIDFGKFLGDAEMFGNLLKRDRSPFVLTPDMVYVINGGEKPSYKFQRFVDLCCDAFNVLRNNSDLFLNLFALMTNAGIPGVTGAAVKYVQRALLPGMTRPEAMAQFTQMIRSAMHCWFTQANFFIHSLGQLRFAGEGTDEETGGNGGLLSFVPKRHSVDADGEDRIVNASVYGIQKRYGGGKQYMYIARVRRENQNQPSYLFRSYKEFLELHQKLCTRFPFVEFSSLPTGVIGRSHVRDVAERRKYHIDKFLYELFRLREEIAHCDLVYTFFHPLLRDQEEADIHALKLRQDNVTQRPPRQRSHITGKLQLSFCYSKDAFRVMVHHARDLATRSETDPSVYVKLYLLPDPQKRTKRKTRIVAKTRHPTFMEMIEYRVPIGTVATRTLQVAVYGYDKLQENEFLGRVLIPLADRYLTQETVAWFTLQG